MSVTQLVGYLFLVALPLLWTGWFLRKLVAEHDADLAERLAAYSAHRVPERGK